MNVTVSGRYNRYTVDNPDRLNPIAGPGSLDGDYVFQRFNPAVGITWSPISSVNAYARYSQGSRAPTSIELGCADPANPCSLPNALASDPPLQQVVTDTWEAGLRGKPEIPFIRNLNWNVGAFRAENRNDILFVSSVVVRHRLFPELRQNAPGGVRCRSRWAHRAASPGASIRLFCRPPTRAPRLSTARRTTPATARWRDIRDSTATSIFIPAIGFR